MDEPSIELGKFVAACQSPSEVNIEKSQEFLINHRGNNLHVRTYWPDTEPEAVVVFLHGYASHISRPTHRYFSREFVKNDYAYITMDYFGHGYSDGLRGMVNSEDDIVDDILSLLFAIYSTSNETDYYKILRNAPKNTPLYLIGHSMGGANAILLSNLLYDPKAIANHTDYSLEHRDEVNQLGSVFQGCILLCPAIVVPKPSPMLIFLLENFLVPLFPESPIPAGLSTSNDTDIWSDAEYLKYVKHDRFPDNPNGLTWGGTIRFGTAHNMILMTNKVIASLETISYPFLVYHDPEDKVTCYAGTERLMAESITDPSEKTFVSMPGGLHDLTANRLGTITEGMLNWIKTRQGVKKIRECGCGNTEPHQH